MKTIPIQSFLLPLLLFISLSFLEAGAQSEAQALLKWKSSLFQPHALSSCFLANSTTPCTWFGVRCNSVGSVVRLSVPNANLNGTLDDLDFASLPGLTKLNLNINLLYGSIPSNISALSKLTALDLSINNLNGTIPVEIGNMPALASLDLSNNQLERELPDTIAQLPNLEFISVSNNNLSGHIPRHLGQNGHLNSVIFSNNSFSGELPPDLCKGFALRPLMGLNLVGPGYEREQGWD
uniref:Probable leucine-rich repeat receptor-like protein kinase At1g35710 n=1 Tax=Elaeis guineensis var. tenera TaxID=51953 RepID=A0A6J0PGR1_ELAGV|nr:probable leucine-rich repeat receptor-like protein kinase At1g35710 [Elaeis guineensis]